MMVAMGSAMFVIAGTEIASSAPAELTRVIQGVATGIGFLGAGTILQLSDRMEIKGLTTASSVWTAAAVGTAAGLGQYELAVGGTLVSIVVLSLLKPLDRFFSPKGKSEK
jgi:putative Mg2+ transporter-C (MgtC) family protein